MNSSNVYTIFVDRLPHNMNSRWLKNIFKTKGEIIDVYVSFKNRKSSNFIFGFVRFSSKAAAQEAISTFNGKMLMKNSLKVGWAKFRRNPNEIGFNDTHKSYKYELRENLLLASIEEKLNNFKKDIMSSLKAILVEFTEENHKSMEKVKEAVVVNCSALEVRPSQNVEVGLEGDFLQGICKLYEMNGMRGDDNLVVGGYHNQVVEDDDDGGIEGVDDSVVRKVDVGMFDERDDSVYRVADDRAVEMADDGGVEEAVGGVFNGGVVGVVKEIVSEKAVAGGVVEAVDGVKTVNEVHDASKLEKAMNDGAESEKFEDDVVGEGEAAYSKSKKSVEVVNVGELEKPINYVEPKDYVCEVGHKELAHVQVGQDSSNFKFLTVGYTAQNNLIDSACVGSSFPGNLHPLLDNKACTLSIGGDPIIGPIAIFSNGKSSSNSKNFRSPNLWCEKDFSTSTGRVRKKIMRSFLDSSFHLFPVK